MHDCVPTCRNCYTTNLTNLLMPLEYCMHLCCAAIVNIEHNVLCRKIFLFFFLYEKFYHSVANEATGSSTEC